MSRDPLDRYYTKPWMTRALLEHVDVRGKVLEPCAGKGWIAEVLRKHGCEVVTGDLDPEVDVDHRWSFPEAVALGRVPTDVFDWVITNPPFYCATEVVRAALQVAPRVAMLLKSRWAEPCKERSDVHRLHPEDGIITLPRDSFPGPTNMRGEGSDNGSVSWFVWERPRRRSCWYVRLLQEDKERLRGQLSLLPGPTPARLDVGAEQGSLL